MIKLAKALVVLGVVVVVALTTVSVQAASETEKLQPALSADRPASATKVADVGRYLDEYSSYMQLSTALHSSETMHLPDVHIGGQGDGGVTFFNGTIINETTTSEGADLPVTFGDGVRIDGPVWRGTSKGVSDSMPLKIADTMVPELTNINDIGSSSLRWDEVWLVDLQGDNSVDEPNLYVNNTPTDRYVLSYDGDGKFVWTENTLNTLSCSDGQVTKWDSSGSAWECATDLDSDTDTVLNTYYGGIIADKPAGENTTIVSGITSVPEFDEYGNAGKGVAVDMTTGNGFGGFSSADTYVVTAGYDYGSAPYGIDDLFAADMLCLTDVGGGGSDFINHCLSVSVVKNSNTEFTVYTHFPNDSSGLDSPRVSWQAIGY